METKYRIEHHFLEGDILPVHKQIDPKVKIVEVKEKGEFFIEHGISKESGKTIINCGGLSITLDQEDFQEAVKKYVQSKLDKRSY